MLVLFNIIIRALTSLVMLIPDCDETFNYWEPLNLLLRGFGKQTWEYSPEFAIRSYAYLMPYFLIISPFKYFLEVTEVFVPSYVYFYAVRGILASFTVYSEWKLYNSLLRNFNVNVARSYLFLSTVSTGMAHAGVELLPSSFAMQCMTIALSYSLDEFTAQTAVSGLTWIMIGGLVGWPFGLALAVPFGIYVVLKQTRSLLKVVLGCLVNLVSILVLIIAIDSLFYKRLVLIPLNIVLYNVFGGEGEGPEIFGTEPLSYYFLNLALNFNLILVLSVLGIALVKANKNWAMINGPLLLWAGVFFSQPHKEERFLYPIYSLIIVNAAISLTTVYDSVQGVFKSTKSSKFVTFVYLLIHLAIAVVSAARTVNLVDNYTAPITVARELASSPIDTLNTSSSINVCIGREWYHFPNSFFLPDNHRLRFVKSGFDGLLPRDFNENASLFDVTSFVPDDMNNKNIFSDTTIIPFEQCDYYIDNSGRTNGFEPDIIGNDKVTNWTVLTCEKLINPDGNHGIGRLIYIPQSIREFVPYNVEYMDFCLLQHVQ